MKKIMFNEAFGLTQAVLNHRKTQMRRVATQLDPRGKEKYKFLTDKRGRIYVEATSSDGEPIKVYPKYQPGDILAIGQPYKEVYNGNEDFLSEVRRVHGTSDCESLPGWANKLHTRPELMPHQILIKDVRIERLRDVTTKDCFAEGIVRVEIPGLPPSSTPFNYTVPAYVDALEDPWAPAGDEWCANDPNTALCVMFYKLSRDNTFLTEDKWLFAYDFTLIK